MIYTIKEYPHITVVDTKAKKGDIRLVQHTEDLYGTYMVDIKNKYYFGHTEVESTISKDMRKFIKENVETLYTFYYTNKGCEIVNRYDKINGTWKPNHCEFGYNYSTFICNWLNDNMKEVE